MNRYLLFLIVFISTVSQSSELIIELPNGEHKQVTYRELVSMQSTTVTTHLPWLSGETTFTGVSIEELLTSFSKDTVPSSITVRALNDYSVQINGTDIVKYQPILAYLKNGNKMKIRDKGPYWLIYPLSTYPEIDISRYHEQMVWQVKIISNINND